MEPSESIEGTTPFDADGLLPEGITTMAQLSIVEAVNILKGTTRNLGRKHAPGTRWFTDPFIRKVHRDMFCDVWSWAGEYRTTELTIGVKSYLIRPEIGRLCGDAQFWDEQRENPLPVLERAARIHARLAWIHPFRNGNGRHARLMADIYLNSHGHRLPIWPSTITRLGEDLRQTYLKALKAADQGDFQPLADYTARFIS